MVEIEATQSQDLKHRLTPVLNTARRLQIPKMEL
jgi:hypothetical protein